MDIIDLVHKQKSDFNELVHKRHSERFYFQKNKVNMDAKKLLDDYCSTLTLGPFGTKTIIASTDQYMGTFKVIQYEGDKTQCPYYYIGAIASNLANPLKIGLIDFGYNFEKLILFATQLGFGTCWLGGTYHTAEAENCLKLEKGIPHKIVCISPVGVCKKPSEYGFLQKILNKMLSGAHSRIPLHKIFFVNDFNNPLRPDHPPDALKIQYSIKAKQSALMAILDSFRWSPSASNSQSWRVLFMEKEKCFAFFTSSSSSFYKFIDIGIGMLHWEAAAIEYGMKGHWDIDNTLKWSTQYFKDLKIKLPSFCTYHFAWVME